MKEAVAFPTPVDYFIHNAIQFGRIQIVHQPHLLRTPGQRAIDRMFIGSSATANTFEFSMCTSASVSVYTGVSRNYETSVLESPTSTMATAQEEPDSRRTRSGSERFLH